MPFAYDNRHTPISVAPRYNRDMRPTRILLFAGLLVWALTGVTVSRAFLSGANPWAREQLGAWLLFGSAFLAEVAWPRRIDFRLALALQTVSALLLIWAPGGDGIEAALLVMIGGQLPAVLSMRVAVLWVLGQTVLAFLPEAGGGRLAEAAVSGLAYLSFQLFAVGAAGLAEGERRAREELAGAKSRLEAMQQRLADTSREAERLRIARELHDSLGHHLTALGLDLELARHLAKGDAVPPIERARSLASSLMSELRSAVTELRADSGGDLVGRLQALARSQGTPRVEVEIDSRLSSVPFDVASAFARVAQEIVTNATKHSGASTVKLTLRASATDWTLEGRDDGVGAGAVRSGNGLSGMRERVEGVGGAVRLDTRPGAGFAVIATVPMSAYS